MTAFKQTEKAVSNLVLYQIRTTLQEL